MCVRPVNLRVTRSATLDTRGSHVVETWRVRRPRLVDIAVALKAKLADVAAPEQFRIARAVWSVAACAAFYLRGRVFVQEGALLIRVAFDAGRVRAYGELCLLQFEPAVWVVTIRALHRAFKHLVMERLSELRFRLVVARDAQLSFGFQQHLRRRQIGRVRREGT